MWRRALLGSRDDVVRVGAVGAAFVVGLVLVLAGTLGWSAGTAGGWLLAGSLLVVFRWRRRGVDQEMARLGRDVVAEAETLLRRRDTRPPTPPDPAPGA